MGINPDHYRGAGEKPSEERAQKHEHYAAIYNQVSTSLPPTKTFASIWCMLLHSGECSYKPVNN